MKPCAWARFLLAGFVTAYALQFLLLTLSLVKDGLPPMKTAARTLWFTPAKVPMLCERTTVARWPLRLSLMVSVTVVLMLGMCIRLTIGTTSLRIMNGRLVGVL